MTRWLYGVALRLLPADLRERFGDDMLRTVGVVADVRQHGLTFAPRPEIHLSRWPRSAPWTT